MTDTPPRGKPPAAGSESPEPASPDERDADPGTPEAPVEDPDPFDELWDPNMDTRPERIRRTRSRTRPEPRTRGGGPPRGKRRDAA